MAKKASPAEDGRLAARIRDLRQKRGWTLGQLSAACSVSRSMLSQIERDAVNPTLAVVYRIAQAFEMALGELVEDRRPASTVAVIRGGDKTMLLRSDREASIRALSPAHLEKDVEVYEIRLRPGRALRSAPHFAGTRELLAVQQGAVRVTSGKDRDELAAGDSAHYAADVPHAIENVGRGEAVAYLVDIYRSR